MSNELMRCIDDFIDAAITRLSSGSGGMVSQFRLDLRRELTGRQRITQSLIGTVYEILKSRNLYGIYEDGSFYITVDLSQCILNGWQARDFNSAVAYARVFHGQGI